MLMPAATITRLEKAANDNGFDIQLQPADDWLIFGSTHAPLKIWLTATSEGTLVVALSQANVARALGDLGIPGNGPVPAGASALRIARDVAALHHLLRRAFQLSRTLPDELLHEFEKKIAIMPRSTEAERLVVQRVGQDIFRAGLVEYWEGRCAITGLAVPELLRASHIKPWAECVTDAERLDVFNGLLLAPQLDAAFDQGFITVADDGAVIISPALPPVAACLLGLNKPMRVATLTNSHRTYLFWHKTKVFRSN
jgi:putative restriction endonuclease